MSDTLIVPPTNTVMGMGPEITLPALELRPWGLFTQVVDEVPIVDEQGKDRTAAGAVWLQRGPIVPNAVAVDCDTDEAVDTEEIALAIESTMAFSSFDMLQCSTIGGLGMPEINAMLVSDEEFTRSAALVLALTTVIDANHLNLLVDSTSLGAGTDMADAVGLIEDGLGDRIANGRGHIFIPLRLLAAAFQDSAVMLRGDQLISPAGHRVISDSGHGANNTLFGTGALAYGQTERRLITDEKGYLDRQRNIAMGIWQRYAVVMFNPLHSVRATVS